MKVLKIEEFLNEEENKCEKCKKPGESPLCSACEEEGWWIDPSGGLHSPDDDDPASMYEAEDSTTFTLQQFKDAFHDEYSYMSLDLSDRDIQKYLDQKHVKGRPMKQALDSFADYLLASGQSDVQEKKTVRFKDFLNESSPSDILHLSTVSVNFDTGSKSVGVEGAQGKFEAYLEETGKAWESTGGANIDITDVDVTTSDFAEILSFLKSIEISEVHVTF